MAQNFASTALQITNLAAGTGLLPTAAAGFSDAVIGIRMANITAAAVTVDVFLTPSGGSAKYIVKGLSIPPSSSVELVQGGAKFVINPGDSLRALSSSATSVDVVTSVVDKISAIPS